MDDNKPLREAMHLLLSEDYEVASVGCGEDALDLVPAFDPDVIVLDIMLPGIDGEQVLWELRTHGFGRRVIAISGIGAPHLAHRVCRNGAREFLEKPISIFQLKQSIEEALRD